MNPIPLRDRIVNRVLMGLAYVLFPGTIGVWVWSEDRASRPLHYLAMAMIVLTIFVVIAQHWLFARTIQKTRNLLNKP